MATKTKSTQRKPTVKPKAVTKSTSIKTKKVAENKKLKTTNKKTTSLKTTNKIVKAKKVKAKVQPIPKGYAVVTPYLIVNDAEKVLEFYKKGLGAKEVMRHVNPSNKIMHAEIKIGDSIIKLAEEAPEMQCYSPKTVGGSPVLIHLYVKNVDKLYQQAIKAGAKEQYPVQDQFYGDRSGSIVDPFGHVWCISTHIEDLSVREIKKRAAAMQK